MTLLLHRQTHWPSTDLSTILDLHWSNHREQFVILTREDLYILVKNVILNDVLHKKSKNFRTLTSDDAQNALFIATTNTIEEYLLSILNFSKRRNLDRENIYSLRFNSKANQFGLIIGKFHEHKWYFEQNTGTLAH
ncbi:unnamed protein product [Rotaria socialis]